MYNDDTNSVAALLNSLCFGQTGTAEFRSNRLDVSIQDDIFSQAITEMLLTPYTLYFCKSDKHTMMTYGMNIDFRFNN